MMPAGFPSAICVWHRVSTGLAECRAERPNFCGNTFVRWSYCAGIFIGSPYDRGFFSLTRFGGCRARPESVCRIDAAGADDRAAAGTYAGDAQAASAEVGRKSFFFEKKKQKTFASFGLEHDPELSGQLLDKYARLNQG
jgi:hypothetical protein